MSQKALPLEFFVKNDFFVDYLSLWCQESQKIGVQFFRPILPPIWAPSKWPYFVDIKFSKLLNIVML